MKTGVGNDVSVLDIEDDVRDSEVEAIIEDVVSLAAQQKCDVIVLFYRYFNLLGDEDVAIAAVDNGTVLDVVVICAVVDNGTVLDVVVICAVVVGTVIHTK